jgi:hypothetical protein
MLAGIEMLVQQIAVERIRIGAYVFAGFAFASVTVGFIQRTRDYLPVWRNDFALWEHAVAHVPELSVVQIQRATSLHNAGQTDAALEALEYALTHCEPDSLDRERIEAKRGETNDPKGVYIRTWECGLPKLLPRGKVSPPKVMEERNESFPI